MLRFLHAPKPKSCRHAKLFTSFCALEEQNCRKRVVWALGAFVTSKAEVFRSKAAEADRLAQSALNSEMRNGYQQLAKSWRQMAEQVEAFESRYGGDKSVAHRS